MNTQSAVTILENFLEAHDAGVTEHNFTEVKCALQFIDGDEDGNQIDDDNENFDLYSDAVMVLVEYGIDY